MTTSLGRPRPQEVALTGADLQAEGGGDGGNGHSTLEAQQHMLVASIAALGRERGLALGRSMFTVWNRLPPGDDEAYILECLATEGDLGALRAVIARWLPRLFVEGGGTDGRN